jgi:hypothetical protein
MQIMIFALVTYINWKKRDGIFPFVMWIINWFVTAEVNKHFTFMNYEKISYR